VGLALQSSNCKLQVFRVPGGGDLGDGTQIDGAGTAGSMAIAEALLSENCKLIELDLASAGVSDAAGVKIGEALSRIGKKLKKKLVISTNM
jgi:hypothetical protein